MATSEPRDAKLLALLLASMGVKEVDPKTIPMLLEFAYRYSAQVLQDAKDLAVHSGRTELNMADVRYATQYRVDHSFALPPNREDLMSLAKIKNAEPLPALPEKYGIRLPPEKHALLQTEYRLVCNEPNDMAIDSAPDAAPGSKRKRDPKDDPPPPQPPLPHLITRTDLAINKTGGLGAIGTAGPSSARLSGVSEDDNYDE